MPGLLPTSVYVCRISSIFSILVAIMLGYGWLVALRGEADDSTTEYGSSGVGGVVELGPVRMKKQHLLLGTLSISKMSCR